MTDFVHYLMTMEVMDPATGDIHPAGIAAILLVFGFALYGIGRLVMNIVSPFSPLRNAYDWCAFRIRKILSRLTKRES